MKTENYLLPCYFRFIGFGMIIPLIGIGLYALLDAGLGDLVSSVMRSLNKTFPEWLETYYFVLTSFDGSFYDLFARIGWPLCLLFIAFSREKEEDEYIQQIRMRSLVFAFMAEGVLILLITPMLRHLDYLFFMSFSFYLVLLLYIFKFRIAIFRLNRRINDEK